jgi:hypothetical protein
MTEHTRDREWLIAAFREVAEMDQRTDERKRGQNYEDAADAVIERLRGDGEREPVYVGFALPWEVYDQTEPYITIYRTESHPHMKDLEAAGYNGPVPVTVHPVGERQGERIEGWAERDPHDGVWFWTDTADAPTPPTTARRATLLLHEVAQ